MPAHTNTPGKHMKIAELDPQALADTVEEMLEAGATQLNESGAIVTALDSKTVIDIGFNAWLLIED